MDDLNKKNGSCHVCGCVFQILHGFGKFCIGLASILAVFYSKDIVTEIYKIQLAQSQSQVQEQSQHITIIENTKNIADDLTKLTKQATIDKETVFKEIPNLPPLVDGKLNGVYILNEFREPFRIDLDKAKSPFEREKVIKDYFEFSKRETKLQN